VDIKPILSHDKEAVAAFLHKHLFTKISTEQWVYGLFPRWSEEFPNHGHMIVDNDEIVGVQIVIYSKLLYEGKEVVFGNLSSWCVLEEYRKGLTSIMLLRKNISDKTVNYTTTTPNETAQKLLSKFGFETIDNSIYLIPNIPGLYSKSTILSDEGQIASSLDESNLRIYNDHKYIPWLKHLLISDAEGKCYVIYRDWKTRRSKHLKNSRILYISNPEIFHKQLRGLRCFFLSRGYPATTVSKRFLKQKPSFSFERTRGNPLCYRGSDAPKEAFTNAYTQVMTFEAHY
jgi:hypothetical protein